MALLNTNRKSYVGIATAPLSCLTLKCKSEGHSDFEGLYLVKELN